MHSSPKLVSVSRLAAILIVCTGLLVAGCTGGGGGGGGALSGTYEAKTPDGSMALDFKAGNKVHLTMRDKGGQPDSSEGDYMVEGDHVTIQVPGSPVLVLTHKGNVLEGDFMAQILRFVKK